MTTLLWIGREKKKKSLACPNWSQEQFCQYIQKKHSLMFPKYFQKILWKGHISIKVWQQHKNISQWLKKKYLLNSTFLKGSQLAYKQVMDWTGYKQIHVLTKTFATFSIEHLKDIHSNNYNVLWILNRETAAFQKIHFPKTAYNSVCQ